MNWLTAVRTETRTPLLQVGKSALAGIVTWIVCILIFPAQVPVFGAIAALFCVQPSVFQSLSKAVERLVGVVAGVVVSSALILVFGQHTSWLFAVVIALSLLLGWALRLTSPSSTQIAITGMLVMALGASDPAYAVERIVETLIGAVIGTVVNLLIAAPILDAPVHLAVTELGRNTAAALDRLADSLTTPRDPAWLADMLKRSRALRDERSQSRPIVRAGEESLRLNPRRARRRPQLERDIATLERLDPVLFRVRGMTRTVCDHYSPALASDPIIADIAEQLRRAAHDVRVLARVRNRDAAAPGTAGGADANATAAADDRAEDADAAAAPADTALPALTSQLRVATPPANWIVIGALLEDLRRVHEELSSTEAERDSAGPEHEPEPEPDSAQPQRDGAQPARPAPGQTPADAKDLPGAS